MSLRKKGRCLEKLSSKPSPPAPLPVNSDSVLYKWNIIRPNLDGGRVRGRERGRNGGRNGGRERGWMAGGMAGGMATVTA